MRDKNRIRPFLDKFAELWESKPDARFGQLLTIIYNKSDINPFYAEDEIWLKAIEEEMAKDIQLKVGDILEDINYVSGGQKRYIVIEIGEYLITVTDLHRKYGTNKDMWRKEYKLVKEK